MYPSAACANAHSLMIVGQAACGRRQACGRNRAASLQRLDRLNLKPILTVGTLNAPPRSPSILPTNE